jgi:hypothetical protein
VQYPIRKQIFYNGSKFVGTYENGKLKEGTLIKTLKKKLKAI